MSMPPAVDFSKAPFLVIWETTQACDLTCHHCRAEAQPHRLPGELSTDEGKKLLDDVISVQSNIARAHNLLGCIAASRGQFSQAADYFDRSLQLDPDNPDYRRNMAAACEKTGRMSEAMNHYKCLVSQSSVYSDYARRRLASIAGAVVK